MAKRLWSDLFYLGLMFSIMGMVFLAAYGVSSLVAEALPGDDWWPLIIGLGWTGLALFIPGASLASIAKGMLFFV